MTNSDMVSGKALPLTPTMLSGGVCLNPGPSYGLPITETGKPLTPKCSDTAGSSNGSGLDPIDRLMLEAAAYERRRSEADMKPVSTKFRKHGKYLWNMYKPRDRVKFATWLKNIPDAEYFLNNEQRMVFLTRISKNCRKLVKGWLKRKDPVGLSQLNGKLRSYCKMGAKKKALLQEFLGSSERDLVMMEKEELKTPGVSVVQVVPKHGTQLVIGGLVVSGVPRDEIASILNMDLTELNGIVDGLDLENQQKILNDAIQAISSGMVVKDLVKGVISQQTMDANKIAMSRKKVQIEESREVRELRKERTATLATKTKDAESRFLNVVEVKEVTV